MGPLDGVRVLDLCDPKGQYMGRLLASHGADVIKIEPLSGDPGRRIGPFADDVPSANRSLFWWYYNADKRSAAIDLWQPDGAELVRRLAGQADVVLESFAPGALARVGLDYASLASDAPELIYTSLSPFGQTGPWAGRAWTDAVGLALGGPMSMCGYDHVPDMPPIRPTEHQACHIGSHFGAIGTIVALIERAASGQGQYVDASIHEACAVTTEAGMPYALFEKQPLLRQTGRHAAATPTDPWNYPAADGREINIFGMPRGDAGFLKLVAWAEENDMVGNLRDPELRDAHKRQLGVGQESVRMMLADLAAFIASKPSQEIYRGAQDRGAAWGIINAPDELLSEEHFHQRGFWTDVEHDELGRSITYPGAPAKLLGTPWAIRHRAPLLGEHTQAILADDLSLDAAAITALVGAGIAG